MSAYAVDVEHINTLVCAGLSARTSITWAATDEPTVENGIRESCGYRYRQLDHQSADVVGQLLVSANWASVNYRYSENEIEMIYVYHTPRRGVREPVEILKAIGCLRYQSCEVPDWATSEAAQFLDALEHEMIGRLPGFSEAAWEITEQSETLEDTRRTAALARRAARAA